MDDASADDVTSLRMEQKIAGVFEDSRMTGMTVFFQFLLVALAVMIGVYLYRVIKGPTVFDRILGLNGISTKAIILLVVIGTVYDRVDMFVDISTGYALLNSGCSVGHRKVSGGTGDCLDVSGWHGFILVGLFFLLVAAIGMVRLPDVFTRSHAAGHDRFGRWIFSSDRIGSLSGFQHEPGQRSSSFLPCCISSIR